MKKSTLEFLKSLKKHNKKEWFLDNQKDYKASLEDFTGFIQELINGISQFDAGVGRLRARDCIFRIFRDVRFAHDKSPYKDHFGAWIAPGGRKSIQPGYYFHLEPGGIFAGGGLHMPPGPQLLQIRRAIDASPGSFRKILSAPSFKKNFKSLSGETLKSAPRGFARDNPNLDLLRYKSYVALRNFSDAECLSAGFLRKALPVYKEMLPLNKFLARAVGK